MSVCAAVTTGKGASAIATIQVFGPAAPTLFAQIFRPAGAPRCALEPGRISLGSIVRDDVPLDQVVLACEARDLYAIHCHGNPLIVEKAMALLARHQVELVPAETMHCRVWRSQGHTALSIEARLALLQAQTLTGTRIIMHQMKDGLARILSNWQAQKESMSLQALQVQAQTVLAQSRIARRIIYGAKAALIGPPNTGKSTLLNALVGQPRALVADVGGTTRDWIEAPCRLDSLYLTLIDTAGLDARLTKASEVDRMSQGRTLDLLGQADLVLVVLDASDGTLGVETRLMERMRGKCTLTVLNKSDLVSARGSPQALNISATQETGLSELKQRIRVALGITGFDPETPVCFTERQRHLLTEMLSCQSRRQVQQIIAALLHASLESIEPVCAL